MTTFRFKHVRFDGPDQHIPAMNEVRELGKGASRNHLVLKGGKGVKKVPEKNTFTYIKRTTQFLDAP